MSPDHKPLDIPLESEPDESLQQLQTVVPSFDLKFVEKLVERFRQGIQCIWYRITIDPKMKKEANVTETLQMKLKETQLAWEKRDVEKLGILVLYLYQSYFAIRIKVLSDGVQGPNFRKVRRCQQIMHELVGHEKDYQKVWEILEWIENMISPLEVSNPGSTSLRLKDYFDTEHNLSYSTKLMCCSKGTTISELSSLFWFILCCNSNEFSFFFQMSTLNKAMVHTQLSVNCLISPTLSTVGSLLQIFQTTQIIVVLEHKN